MTESLPLAAEEEQTLRDHAATEDLWLSTDFWGGTMVRRLLATLDAARAGEGPALPMEAPVRLLECTGCHVQFQEHDTADHDFRWPARASQPVASEGLDVAVVQRAHDVLYRLSAQAADGGGARGEVYVTVQTWRDVIQPVVNELAAALRLTSPTSED